MQIRLPFEELLKRLLLLGLPLLPVGCTAGQNPDSSVRCPHIFENDLTIQMPAMDPDGGMGVTLADWLACVNTASCMALCQEVTATSLGFPPKQVTACERKPAGGDAGQPADPAGGPAVTIHLAYSYNDCTGRRPEGLVPCGRAAGDADIGRWLAQVAALEAASVPAFGRLASELDAHGAPGHLVRAARAAQIDETRHYSLMAA
ncbi:MAG TPA: hypothetical protein VNO55_23660, partial [Polyangia bacterium]|nr:hypothetical protein [Polyangia bacterium]